MYKYIYIYNNNFYIINDHIMTFPIQKLLVALWWLQMNVALVTSPGQFNPDGEGRCSQELKGEMFLFYFIFWGGNVFKARYPAQRNYFFWNLDYSHSWNKSTPSVLDTNLKWSLKTWGWQCWLWNLLTELWTKKILIVMIYCLNPWGRGGERMEILL